MRNTRVKICGITRPEDAQSAAENGADAIGLNFFAGPRKISLNMAHEIVASIPPLVTPVALTSGPTVVFPEAPTIAEIQNGYVVREKKHPLPIHTFQIYGDGFTALPEKPYPQISLWGVYHFVDYAGLFECEWMKNFFPSLIVVDKASSGQLGGTGKTLDWNAVAEARVHWSAKDLPPIILAGGLTPDNVAEAIRIVQPYAVDVSSGVEVAGKPGVKDPIKMRDFIQAARGV